MPSEPRAPGPGGARPPHGGRVPTPNVPPPGASGHAGGPRPRGAPGQPTDGGMPPGAGPGSPQVPEAAPFATPRRLHPASVVLGIDLRQLFQAVFFPLVATAAAPRQMTLAILIMVGLIGLVVRVLAWQRFTFSFDGEVLRVDEGVLSRNRRSLDVARIQQVEVDRSWLHRMFGLASLRVETAGSSTDVEAELRVVTEAEAEALRAAVRAGQVRLGRVAPGPEGDAHVGGRAEPASRHVLSVPIRDVVLASVTGARLLVLPAVLAGLFQFVGDPQQGALFDPRTIVNALVDLGIAIAVALIPLTIVAAIVVGVLRDANFRIERVDDDLHISRGLVSTRQSVVPLRRIQLVEIHRNGLRRLLGVGTVRIHSAGGSNDADRRVSVPLLRNGEFDALIAEVLPGAPGVPHLRRHPANARRRAIWRWLRPASIPLLVLWALPFEPPESLVPIAIGLLPLAVVLGIVEHRHLAHGASDRIVAARQGAISVTTSLAPLVKVQAVSGRANPFQRHLGLATARAHVAGPGGDVVVLDAAAEDADRLRAMLTEHAAHPVLVGPAAEEPVSGDTTGSAADRAWPPSDAAPAPSEDLR
jgi:putative membrane protein